VSPTDQYLTDQEVQHPGWIPVATPRWRATDHEGRPAPQAPAVPRDDDVTGYSVAFHPMNNGTVATLINVRRRGPWRWSRRVGSVVLPVSRADLAVLDDQRVLRELAQALLLATRR
jgi:hypothetical protein